MSNTVNTICRQRGIAGEFSLTANVTYSEDDYSETSEVTFVGSTYGGPIVMVTPSGAQTFVSRDVTDRIGSRLDDAWVRRFFE